MFKLLPVFFICIVLSVLSVRRTQIISSSRVSQIDNNNVKNEKFFFVLMCVVMIAFLGTRIGYNDTYTYTQMYEQTSSNFSDIFNVSWSLSDVPGFTIVNIFLRSIGTTTQNFIMFYAAVNVPIYLWFLRKYSVNFPLTIFFFFTMEIFVFMAAAIKQVTAVAFALIAIDKLINKKYILFFIFTTICCLFHPYAVVFYLAPLLFFKPWSSYTIVLVIVGVIIAFAMKSLFGVVDSVTTSLGGEHSESYYSSEGVNIFRFLVSLAPFLLSFLMCKNRTTENAERKDCFIFNLAFLNCVLMFIALFGTGNQFGRFANYFLVFQAINLPWIIEKLYIEKRKPIIMIVSICYFAFFYYAYAINGNFDHDYWKMSITDYLSSWF